MEKFNPEKEKAKYLMEKFNLPTGLMSREIKQCVLICVDEIIAEMYINGIDESFWKKVKKEIEKD